MDTVYIYFDNILSMIDMLRVDEPLLIVGYTPQVAVKRKRTIEVNKPLYPVAHVIGTCLL